MSNGFSEEKALRLDTLASKAMEMAHAPGASVCLLRDGELVYAKGYGGRSVEDNLPATPDTLYGIGSCSKSFTCLALMQLAEKGKLSVHDQVADYLPVKIGFPDAPITLHHLMSHSSGIPSLGTANILIEQLSMGGHPIPLVGDDDFYSYLNAAGEQVDARPGEKYFYLNAGYTLLGFVVERVSGVRLDEYVRRNILDPLEMSRTTYLREEAEADPDRMTPYMKEKDGTLKPTIHPYHRLIHAPGGILSSVRELTHYLRMYLDGGSYEGKRLLDAESLSEMCRPHVARPPGPFGEGGYGYGWGVSEGFLGQRLVVHTGSTGVSSAFLGFIPDLGIAVSYLSNTGYWSSAIPHAALALLMDRDPLEDIPYIRAERHLSGLTGTYASYRDVLKVDVVKRGPLLYAETKGRWAETSVPLIPASERPDETIFYVPNSESGRMKAEFVREGGRTRLYWERWVLHKKP